MIRWCGWQIPGWPAYVCLLDEHGDEVQHRPVLLSRDAFRALLVVHGHGYTVHRVATS